MAESYTYNKYSEYLYKKYNTKVYKLPINIDTTCPNRDGTVGFGGCVFCGEEGAGFEMLSSTFSVTNQLGKNMDYIKKRYKAEKFIAYFQNYTNTYVSLDKFEKMLIEAAEFENIVEIAISTRPDAINNKYLEIAKEVSDKYKVNICFELGLQTVNYHSLKKINRGHSLAEFIDAVLNIHSFGFDVCTHLILNLPYDNMDDVIETSKIMSSLKVEQIKLHALYIVKNTVMGKAYENKEFEIINLDEYKQRVITFLEYLSPDITVQRIIGRAPEENTLFVNWNTSWWKIRDDIELIMVNENRYQGKLFNYLSGKAVKKFL